VESVTHGIDGRIHYAETGKLAGPDLLEPGMMVALSGGGGKGQNAQRPYRSRVLLAGPAARHCRSRDLTK